MVRAATCSGESSERSLRRPKPLSAFGFARKVCKGSTVYYTNLRPDQLSDNAYERLGMDTPAELWYKCLRHKGMGGKILVRGGTAMSCPASGSGLVPGATSNGTGVSSGNHRTFCRYCRGNPKGWIECGG